MSNFDFNAILTGMINNALTPDVSSVTSEHDDGNGNVMVVTKKVYNLVNHKKDHPTVTVMDTLLVREMDRFLSADKAQVNLMYVKCKALANMTTRIDVINSMGYKTIGDFAHAFAGINAKTANQYVRIGKWFVNDDFSVNEFPINTSVSAMLETLAYVTDELGNYKEGTIKALYESNVLIDGMTTAKVREALKKHKASVKALETGEETPALTEGKEDVKSSEKEGKEDVKSSDADVKANAMDALRQLNNVEAAAYVNNVLDSVITALSSHDVDVNDPDIVNAIEILRKHARNMVVTE